MSLSARTPQLGISAAWNCDRIDANRIGIIIFRMRWRTEERLMILNTRNSLAQETVGDQTATAESYGQVFERGWCKAHQYIVAPHARARDVWNLNDFCGL